MSYRDRDDFAKETGPTQRLLRGMIRKLVVTLSDGARWQFLGQRGGQGGDEVITAEPFTGIGFYSRPPADGKPEAIAVAVGGAKHLAVVATRDEETRRKVAGDLDEGETQIHSTGAIVRVKESKIEARTASGNAAPVATLQDLRNLYEALDAAITAVGPPGNAALVAFKAALDALGFPAGTEVFEAE